MSPRILLVEDDPVSREIISSLLASRGYEVDTAEDGFSALRMAQDKNYALVFIDYHLPEMDGYALARLMRSLGEKTNACLKMVAITADQFGLAARRGVDTIFDCLLSKPIEPSDLFTFVDEFLGAPEQLAELESFLAPDSTPLKDPSCPGLALWRAQGLDAMPTAKVFPPPTPGERANVEHCFRITEAASADCIILLSPAGLSGVEALRREGPSYLMPLVVLDPALEPCADVLFEPARRDLWAKAADLLSGFARRRNLLAHSVACSGRADLRLAGYLYAADRPLELHRSPTGQTVVPYTAGFPVSGLVASTKQLAAAGLIAPKLEALPDGTRRMVVTLTQAGVRQLTEPAAADRPNSQVS